MRFVLLGGGDIRERGGSAVSVDEKLADICGRSGGNLLFIPTAQEDSEGYCDTFSGLYSELGCRVRFLKLYRDGIGEDEIDELIWSAHMVYVGGGNLVNMLEKWEEWGIASRLRRAGERGLVLAGISAGASCWCSRCVSNSNARNGAVEPFSEVNCLNFLSLNFCPHFNDPRRRDFTIELARGTGRCYCGVTDGAAIFVPRAGEISFFSSGTGANVYRVAPGGEISALVDDGLSVVKGSIPL
ncbi:MAG: peptidase E [Rickettsiales bacterium]|jgi:dipeptidase E|nr:peptidase E [Rickettsiales bacterium]